MKTGLVKILGIYLIAICVLQIWLYLAMSFVDIKENLWLLYLEPRIGIVVIIELFARGAQGVILLGILRWVLVFWTLVLGLLMFFGRPLLKTYIVSEITLAIPNLVCLLLLVGIVAINLNSAPKYELGMSIIPFLVAVFITVIPLVWAIGLLLNSWFKGKPKSFA